MAKSYYPKMRQLNHHYLHYLTRYLAQLTNTVGGPTTSYATDLNALITALSQVETNWPTYHELP